MISRKERMAELVRRIPQNYERKAADAPNALETLKAELIDQFEQKYKKYLEILDQKVEAIKQKGVVGPEAEQEMKLLAKRIDGFEAELRRPDAHLPEMFQTGPTVGERFAKSDAVKDMAGRWRRGGMSVKFEGEFNPFFGHETKTTITSAAVGSSTPGILVPQRVPGIIPKAERALRIRDLLPVRSTTNNAVEYIQENVFTSAASPVVEATDKAESALTFTIASDSVRTIAHWIPATRQILDDFEGLRNFIDRKLLYGLKLKEDEEILKGDNLGQHLNGLTTRSTAYAGTYAVALDTKIDKLRHAKLELEVANEVGSGVVLNPIDWEDIELVKDDAGGANTGRYIIGIPGAGVAVPTIWNMPVVVSNSMPSGKFLVGNFAQQAELWDRMEAVIDISSEHSDYFIKNMVAIRAEERLCLSVYRTSAFVYGNF